MAGRAWGINADSGDPAYAAAQGRRLMSTLLTSGVSQRVGARQGIRPTGQSPVSLSGSTLTVHPHQGVLHPALTSNAGAYLYEEEGDSFSLTPPDGTHPRIDIVVERVWDHDEDTSGERKLEPEYIVGTPGSSPTAPATPAGALRLGRVNVPASGGGSPSFTLEAPYTVSSGGILPVRSAAERPSSGRYEGMKIWRMDLDRTQVWDGSEWIFEADPPAAASSFSSDNQTVSAGAGDVALGSQVSVTVGPGGIAIINYNVFIGPDTATASNILEQFVRATGANSFDTRSTRQRGGQLDGGSVKIAGVDIRTGLNPGSTTFALYGTMSTNSWTKFDARLGVVSF